MQITGASLTGCSLSTLSSCDPNYNNVSLLLPMNGTNGSTTFTDYSPTPKTVTPSGGAQITTANFKWNGSSGFFDGGGDYLTVNGASAFDFGTGDFTVELWSYLLSDTSTYKFIFSLGYPGASGADMCIRYGDAGFGKKLQVSLNSGSVSTVWSCNLTSTTDKDKWQHIAFTRQSGVCRLFVDGVQQSLNNGANPITFPFTSFTDNSNIIGTTSLFIAGIAANYWYAGNINDFRITNGVARYTSNFTPPTAPFPTIGC